MNRPLFLTRMRQAEFDPPEYNVYASLNKDDASSLCVLSRMCVCVFIDPSEYNDYASLNKDDASSLCLLPRARV